MLVVMIDELADGVLQLQRAAVHPAPDLLLGQLGKAALHQIQPGRRRGSEVQVEVRDVWPANGESVGFCGCRSCPG